jgi:TPR repeat protein
MIEEGHVLDVPSGQRIDKAVQFYEKSARQGNSDAMTDLGFMNEKGLLRSQNINLREAIEHYRKAIEANNPRAMNNMAGLYLAGIRII